MLLTVVVSGIPHRVTEDNRDVYNGYFILRVTGIREHTAWYV